jgi:hypothetical protein
LTDDCQTVFWLVLQALSMLAWLRKVTSDVLAANHYLDAQDRKGKNTHKQQARTIEGAGKHRAQGYAVKVQLKDSLYSLQEGIYARIHPVIRFSSLDRGGLSILTTKASS